jgi:hypothetical protein
MALKRRRFRFALASASRPWAAEFDQRKFPAHNSANLEATRNAYRTD